jgi:MFS family permease
LSAVRTSHHVVDQRIDRSLANDCVQAGVVVMFLVINLIEGFDILVIAFAASGIAKEWSLTASQVGVLLSSSLVGMALGLALIAALSDRIGRRPHTLIYGVGWAMAGGPLGAFSALALVGLLLDHEWSARSLFGLLVLPLVMVAALIAVIVGFARRSQTSAEPAESLSPVN